jgi:hypothetical protein
MDRWSAEDYCNKLRELMTTRKQLRPGLWHFASPIMHDAVDHPSQWLIDSINAILICSGYNAWFDWHTVRDKDGRMLFEDYVYVRDNRH